MNWSTDFRWNTYSRDPNRDLVLELHITLIIYCYPLCLYAGSHFLREQWQIRTSACDTYFSTTREYKNIYELENSILWSYGITSKVSGKGNLFCLCLFFIHHLSMAFYIASPHQILTSLNYLKASIASFPFTARCISVQLLPSTGMNGGRRNLHSLLWLCSESQRRGKINVQGNIIESVMLKIA